MNLGLMRKRVLVAGGSRGIGFAIACGFLQEGARVAIVARGEDSLAISFQALAAINGSENVLSIVGDCADASAWPSIVEQVHDIWGGLDVVVANVGDGRSVADAMPDSETFARSWRANFDTAQHTARATLPLLDRTQGCLLFVSSIAGLEAITAPTDYSVAKTAVAALSKQLARKLAPRIRVNCLAPGNICFPGSSWEIKQKAEPERIATLIKCTVPMQRFGTPVEIADAALFLCSERASFISGACLVVDGGQTQRLF